MLLIMLSAIHGWSAGTCNKKSRLHKKTNQLWGIPI